MGMHRSSCTSLLMIVVAACGTIDETPQPNSGTFPGAADAEPSSSAPPPVDADIDNEGPDAPTTPVVRVDAGPAPVSPPDTGDSPDVDTLPEEDAGPEPDPDTDALPWCTTQSALLCAADGASDSSALTINESARSTVSCYTERPDESPYDLDALYWEVTTGLIPRTETVRGTANLLAQPTVDFGDTLLRQLIDHPDDGEVCEISRASIRVTPSTRVLIELDWRPLDPEIDEEDDNSRPVNMDLHMLHVGRGCWLDSRWDVHWRNPAPAWSAGGSPTSSDPRLSIPAQTGAGPELIRFDGPDPNERYVIGVHFRDDEDDGGGAADVHARVWVDGEVVLQVTRSFDAPQEFWELAVLDGASMTLTTVDLVYPTLRNADCAQWLGQD